MSPRCGLVQCVRADKDDTQTRQDSPYFSMLFCCINAFRLGVIIMAAAPLVAPSLVSRSGGDQRNADISSSRPNGQASLSLSFSVLLFFLAPSPLFVVTVCCFHPSITPSFIPFSPSSLFSLPIYLLYLAFFFACNNVHATLLSSPRSLSGVAHTHMPLSELLLPHFHRTHRHCYPSPQAISPTVQTDVLWMECRSVCWAGRGDTAGSGCFISVCTYLHSSSSSCRSLSGFCRCWMDGYGAIQLLDMRHNPRSASQADLQTLCSEFTIILLFSTKTTPADQNTSVHYISRVYFRYI